MRVYTIHERRKIKPCPYCGDPIPKHPRARTCGKRQCQRAHLSAYRKASYPYVPLVRCANCGTEFRKKRNSASGRYYCNKTECLKARRKTRKKIAIMERPRVVSQQEIMFVSDPVFAPLCKFVPCHECKFNDHCRERLKIMMPVACERWSQNDLTWYNSTPLKSQIDHLLQEGLSI